MEHAVRAAEFLRQHGVEVYAEDEAAEVMHTAPLSAAEKVDVMISLGGDGTLLRAVQYAFRWEAAVLGINMGRVGFLTEVEPRDIEAALTAVISGSYGIEERPVLHVVAGERHWHALNDVVLSRGSSARLTTISAWVDGELSGNYVAAVLIAQIAEQALG